MISSKNRGGLRRMRTALVCITLLSAVAAFNVSAEQKVMTPEQLVMIKYVSGIAISPDGQQTAYTLSVPRNPYEEDNGSAWSELHVVDQDCNSRPFITGKRKISSINWRPDGQAISYLAERDDDTVKSLYVIPIDGGESKRLIQFQTSIKSYSWSPDGKQIVFLARDTMNTATEELRDKGFEPKVYEEDMRFVRVWKFDLTDSTASPEALDLPGSASSLSWSPDGKRLALAIAPTPLIDDSYMFRRVSLVDVATGSLIRKYDNPGKIGSMAWSPDGSQLAVVTAADINDPSAGELAVVPVDSDRLKPVITNFDGHVRRVAWTENNQILYHADQGVHTTINILTLDGLTRKTIVPAGDVIFGRLSLSKDRKTLALTGNSAHYPEEVFIYSFDQTQPKRLTNSNPWLDDLKFGTQEILEYEARDGLKLQGILIKPLDYEEGKRYPLILQVHGGPESNYRNGWMNWYSSPAQVFAARGYVVYFPNYRGSTGRGVEFSKMGQNDYAGGEFNDLPDAVDHLVKIGMVDRAKVGITGGSYGGYASAWGATALSDHFAASVMRVGISDLISKFGTTDIPYEMFYVHARRWPWDHWQYYLERSPIYHAQNGKTPLLIIHGENDTRVHPSQSMELYRYLKTLGKVPVRMVFYPDEGHGTSKASFRYDTCLRLLRWMDHYLKGPGGDPPPYEVDYSALDTDKDAD